MKHWTIDKPETVGEALELLHFGVVFKDALTGEIDRVRTERRMDRCAMLLQREISKLQLELAQLNGEIPYGN